MKLGCKTKQIGYMAFEKLCNFPDDGPQPKCKCDTDPAFNTFSNAFALYKCDTDPTFTNLNASRIVHYLEVIVPYGTPC